MSASVIEQRSEEWFAVRRGKVTASRIADLTAKTRSGYGASRANYMAQLIAERLTGIVAESYTNSAMQWGMDQEPAARSLYELLQGVSVEEVGFIVHPDIAEAGASPDGLVGDEGMVEIKCPNTATHIETLLSGSVAGKHIKQMQWQMACADRRWCDFVSFDPRMPPDLQMFVTRVDRDTAALIEITGEVVKFLGELESKIEALKNLRRAT